MPSNVEQIKERLNIVDVISSYIKVEKAGINWKAKCPFHNEKTPSFFISSTRQSFYCFGCGEKGDIFSFVQKFEGLDFRGALEVLAGRAGIELKNLREEGKPDGKNELLEIMEEATKMYEAGLKENKKVLEYLKKRGVSDPTISKWRLGFAENEWRNLYTFLTERGFKKEDMLLAGLIKKVPEETKYYDTFRGRVMFPICDNLGRVIAFSGRALSNDPKVPKYLNSPETKLFYKSEVLHGFHIAKNYIRKLDYTVLVEGQMDLIMSHQSGVTNTVASSGTSLTELHLKKIQKLSNRVIIAYDSDTAGEKAAMKAAELALSLGMETKVASLAEGEDPASIIGKNPEIWKEALRNSVPVIDFALDKALQKNSKKVVVKEILQNVLPLVSLIKSEIEKSQYVKTIAQKIKVGEGAVWSDLTRIEERKDGKMEKFEIIEKDNGNFKDQKEALIFEAEKYGLKIDIEKTNADILRRTELKNLREKLREMAMTLDDPDISKKEEKKTKLEFDKIQKRIRELDT